MVWVLEGLGDLSYITQIVGGRARIQTEVRRLQSLPVENTRCVPSVPHWTLRIWKAYQEACVPGVEVIGSPVRNLQLYFTL